MIGYIYKYLNRKTIKDYLGIINTQYWYLFKDYHLNQALRAYKIQAPELIKQDQDWKLFKIGGYDYYWPAEYPVAELRGLFKEVFGPPNINPHAYETFNTRINSGEWVIDAGASEGFFVRYALLRGANVLALEPNRRLAETLKLTFAQEIKEQKLIIMNSGLGKLPGVSNLSINEQQICSSFISEGNGETVSITTLDEILKQKIIPNINFIKMDIEGGEIDAVMGASEVLRNYKPRLSIAIYHSYKNGLILRDIIKKASNGYQIRFRGIFIREDFGPPRPYMLHAN